jgi:hypothetical protein
MTPSIRKPKPLPAALVLVLLLAAAVLIPFGYGLDLGPGPNRIRALIWEYLDAPWFSGIRFVRGGQVLEALLYTLPRYVFIVQVFNRYRTSSRQKRLWTIGILGAVFPGLISLVQVVGWLAGWTQPPPPVSDHRFPIYLPIPSILVISILLLWLFPPGGIDEKEVS